jgi:hypothetical protein
MLKRGLLACLVAAAAWGPISTDAALRGLEREVSQSRSEGKGGQAATGLGPQDGCDPSLVVQRRGVSAESGASAFGGVKPVPQWAVESS